ncbi:hypothetical protein JTE90_018156 [Oedothorax gibbosus]|uniref:Uncharacterized protein n=1 Tax=Oedothorax gibbosus TaxID=931172 RepID=A0AAV6UA85_9ARAC|nr:hypothetical protein JTE90_018156 [Oedothorax gibbosus]
MSAPPPEPPDLCPPPTPPIASRTRGRTNGFRKIHAAGPQPTAFAESLEALDATIWMIPRKPATIDDTHPYVPSSPSCALTAMKTHLSFREGTQAHAAQVQAQLQESQDTLETPVCPPCEVSLLPEHEDQATHVTDATRSLSPTPSLAEDKIPSSDPTSSPIEDPFRSVPPSPSPKSDHLRPASLPGSPSKKTLPTQEKTCDGPTACSF